MKEQIETKIKEISAQVQAHDTALAESEQRHSQLLVSKNQLLGQLTAYREILTKVMLESPVAATPPLPATSTSEPQPPIPQPGPESKSKGPRK